MRLVVTTLWGTPSQPIAPGDESIAEFAGQRVEASCLAVRVTLESEGQHREVIGIQTQLDGGDLRVWHERAGGLVERRTETIGQQLRHVRDGNGLRVASPPMGEQTKFLGAFGADGPDPALADRLALFGQFVGSWDLEVTNYDANGNASHVEAEWHFGWALAGRAVADVWICPRRDADGRSPQEHGISIRFYDELLGAWRSTWIGPQRRLVRPFVARGVGDRIVLEGSFEPGVTTRWVFSDIAPSTFVWRNEESRDGQTWELTQTFDARRADTA